MDIYNYTYGNCVTEQDVVLALDDFLVNTLGWAQVEKVSDSTSDRDYAWSSTGEEDWVAAGGDPIYIRVRGVSDYLYCYGYRTYTDSTTNTFELYNNPGTHVDLSNDYITYWFYGNKNFVCCIFLDRSTDHPVSCYLGLIESYYNMREDDYPLLIKGNRYQYYSWTYNAGGYMHNCTNSGVQSHDIMDWWNFLQYDLGKTVPGFMAMLPSVVVNTNASNNEMRGEPYGVYQINGVHVPTMGAVATVSGVYLAVRFDQNDQYSHVLGPVASGIDGFNMWPTTESGSNWANGAQV